MQISDVLRYKAEGGNDSVVTVESGTPVRALLEKLAEHRIGAVVVTEGDQVAGIASERDVVRHLRARGAALLEESVDAIMTRELVTCTPQDTLDSIASTMTDRRVRHMPVLDGGRLAGIVSIGDVVSARMRQLEQDRAQLEQYITG